ncbi:MAG: RNA polymerase sigma factor [Candidatus Kapaibacteriota bacterium]|jgi:RNA polymerase sigma-70 factor (ECF subfamily)
MYQLAIKLQSENEIIEEFAKGNVEQAANEFVRRYKNFVYFVALRYVKNHDDAEDIAQDVFIEALEKLKYFRKESSLKTWLYRIAVNKSKNFLRKQRFVSLIPFVRRDDEDERQMDFPDPTQSNRLERKELEEKLIEAINSLPEKQREVFSLRYFENLSFNEISTMLGTSVGGLKANYFHAVRKIASVMKHYLEE